MVEIIFPSLVWEKICGYFAIDQTFIDLICQEYKLWEDIDDNSDSDDLRNYIKTIIMLKDEETIDKSNFILTDFLADAKLIYNHDNYDGYGGPECLVTFDQLYRYKCYYIRIDHREEGSADDRFLMQWIAGEEENDWIDWVLEFLSHFKVIHEYHFDLQKVLSKEKKIRQTVEIFQKLSNKEKLLEYMNELSEILF